MCDYYYFILIKVIIVMQLSERLKKHNIALSHITCVSKLSSFYSSKTKGTVVAQLSSAHREQIRKIVSTFHI